MKILKKIGLTMLVFLIVLVLIALYFLLFVKSIGGKADEKDKADYAARAEYYSDGKFRNMYSVARGFKDPFADRTTGKGTKPKDKLPTVKPSLLENPGAEDFTITWFGHSSLLFQLAGRNILIDPVFSKVASPVSFAGTFRYSDLVCTVEELPHIDVCILSHDHYDHLDTKTIEGLADKTDLFVVPLGVENHLERWGIAPEKIRNMAWWESMEFEGLTLNCVPANHFSGRYLLDSNSTMWAAWVFETENLKIFESGDSGYSEHFQRIYEKFGSFDIMLTDHAQYNETWHSSHMFPEEAVQAALDVHTSLVMPVHWGAFSLAPHAWDESVERFVRYGEEKGLTVITPKLGETVTWDSVQEYQDRWWRDLK